MPGAWTMTEDGEFVLNEPYATKLKEAKHAGAVAWQRAVYQYLEQCTPYTQEQIHYEFARRVEEQGLSPLEIVDEFIIEALEGNL